MEVYEQYCNGQTLIIIVDLGFGDAGKGSIVDYLAHTRGVGASSAIRAGRTLPITSSARMASSHAFCQFGATFKPGVRSHLARSVIVKPENLIYEGRALEEKGFADPFARLSINPRAGW